MNYQSSPRSGVVLLHGEQVVQVDLHAAQLLGKNLDQLNHGSVDDLMAGLQPESARKLSAAIASAADGADVPLLESLSPAEPGLTCFDVLVDRVIFSDKPAVKLILINRSADSADGERLRQHVQRLQILHEIDQAILSGQDEQTTTQVALSRITAFIPHCLLASVALVERVPGTAPGNQNAFFLREADILAVYPPERSGIFQNRNLNLEHLSLNLTALEDGLPAIVHDLDLLNVLGPLQTQMRNLGIRSVLTVPLRSGGRLFGLLNLAAEKVGIFQAEHVQIAQEVADSLAVAIREAHLRRTERQRQQESAVMRDVMAALASAGDLRQTLEVLLVNLHNLINYDRAGLFLVDENDQVVLLDRPLMGPAGVPGITLENHPLVAEMRQTRRPVVVADIQGDPRFRSFPDVDSVRGWLGAPLLAGGKLLGFISLGALEPNAYTSVQVDSMHMFAGEVAQVIERAWLNEQSHRRSEELEVLSNITFALGRAEDGGDTLSAILTQVTRFFEATSGALLVQDSGRNSLVVQAALDPSRMGLSHPYGSDSFWQIMDSGHLQIIPDLDEYLVEDVPPIHRALFEGGGSAVVIPLSSFGTTFGLLSLVFRMRRKFSAQTIDLFHTVAEIVGASLRRAVVLEALENQVAIRTQHLSTLYRINSVAGEPIPLETVLDRVLETAMEALAAGAGFIVLLDERGERLALAAQRGLENSHLNPGMLGLSQLNTPVGRFWLDLLSSPEPWLEADIAATPGFPALLVDAGKKLGRAFIGAPIRAKGDALGALCLFGATILDYSIEDITLFTTIADQIGGLVERARLVGRAELAAVVQERQRLARELHDSVTQLLYSQVLFSGAGLRELRQDNRPVTENHLARIQQAAQQALKEMRLLVYELRPSDELDEGLVGALERRLDAVEKRTGINARLVVSGEPRLDASTAMTLYRIAEEALNNTLKHAAAANVSISLRFEDPTVGLEIVDDGLGFNPLKPRAGGMGLMNMRDRVAGLGGELSVESRPGEGTRVKVRVSLPAGSREKIDDTSDLYTDRR